MNPNINTDNYNDPRSKKNLGPVWHVMHLFAADYPSNPSTEDKQRYKQFYESIGYVLNCKDECGAHYRQMFYHDLPYDENNPFEWTVKAHNMVNRRIGKSEVSLEDAKCMYGVNKHQASGNKCGAMNVVVDNGSSGKKRNPASVATSMLTLVLLAVLVVLIVKFTIKMRNK